MDNSITTLEFCAGYAGIGLGLERVFGDRVRCLAYCELEGFAQANLVSKMETGWLAPAPIWSNLKTFPCRQFHGLVDILIAGYPCQPFSAAGKRLGAEDPRHLWPFIKEAIGVIQPRCVFFENVEGHVSLGLSTVLSDLEETGYRSAWGIFSAAEAGAPHQRKRVFILADRVGQGLEGHTGNGGDRSKPGWLTAAAHGPVGARGLSVADSASNNWGDDSVSGAASENPIRRGIRAWSGGLQVGNHSCAQPWPSRPGEPQHSWEPPRVVGDAKKRNVGRLQRRRMDARAETNIERQTDNNVTHGPGADCIDVADAKSRAGHSQQCGWPDIPHIAGVSPEPAGTGNVANHPGHGRGAWGAESEWEQGRPDVTECGESVAIPSRQLLNGSGAITRETGRGESANESGRKVEFPMGGNSDGDSHRLGYAELCISCDSRIDELRMLGNGVVPATVEIAFRTLSKKLWN